MPKGRVPIRLKLGYRYVTDSNRIMYIVKKFDTTEDQLPYLAKDEADGSFHRYSEKGRYFHGFGNHPLHIKRVIAEDAKSLFYAMHGRNK